MQIINFYQKIKIKECMSVYSKTSKLLLEWYYFIKNAKIINFFTLFSFFYQWPMWLLISKKNKISDRPKWESVKICHVKIF